MYIDQYFHLFGSCSNILDPFVIFYYPHSIICHFYKLTTIQSHTELLALFRKSLEENITLNTWIEVKLGCYSCTKCVLVHSLWELVFMGFEANSIWPRFLSSSSPASLFPVLPTLSFLPWPPHQPLNILGQPSSWNLSTSWRLFLFCSFPRYYFLTSNSPPSLSSPLTTLYDMKHLQYPSPPTPAIFSRDICHFYLTVLFSSLFMYCLSSLPECKPHKSKDFCLFCPF